MYNYIIRVNNSFWGENVAFTKGSPYLVVHEESSIFWPIFGLYGLYLLKVNSVNTNTQI